MPRANLCFDVWVNPGDPSPRLVLADWLEEQGQPTEFVAYLRQVDVCFATVKTIVSLIAPAEFADLIYDY